jgi:hypothetical protein
MDDLLAVEGEMRPFSVASAQRASAMTQRVAELGVEGKRRTTAIRRWQANMQTGSGRTLELIASLMKDLASTANTKYWDTNKELDDFETRMRELLESDKIKQRRQIHKTKEHVKQINEKDDDMLRWARTWGDLTHDWRRDVADKLEEITGSVSADLRSLVADGRTFRLTMENAKEHEKNHMRKSEPDWIFKGAEVNTQNAALWDDDVKNLTAYLNSTEAEEERYAKAAAAAVYKANQEIYQEIAKYHGNSSAAQATKALLDQMMEQHHVVNDLRNELQYKMDTLYSEVKDRLTTPAPSSPTAPPSSLLENAALIQEHEQLEHRFRRLAALARARLRGGEGRSPLGAGDRSG